MSKPLHLITSELYNDKVFHCKFCCGILVSPIMLVKEGNVCFPCYEILKCDKDYTFGVENTALSSIMSKLDLPCLYESEGCSEKMEYGKLLGHQTICKYRPVTCLIVDCSLVCRVKDFISHLHEYHTSTILSSSNDVFDIIIYPQAGSSFAVLKTSCGPFMLQIRLSEDKHKLICMIHGEITKIFKHTFQFEFSEDLNRKVYTECKVIESFNSFLNFDKDFSTVLNLEPFNVHAREQFQITVTFKMKDVNVMMNCTILQLLECPICKYNMKPPIYLCKNGHSLCGSCKSKVLQCSLCKKPFEGARNYGLEFLANNTMYPCNFEEHGCNVLAPIAEHHEMVCTYRLWECPSSNCSETDFYPNLIDHVYNKHVKVNDKNAKNFHTNNCREIWNTKSSPSTQYFLMYDLIFKIKYSYNNNVCKWEAVIIGPWERQCSYIFEIALFKGNCVSGTFTGPCEYEDFDKKSNISFAALHLKQFVEDVECFDYVVNIFRESSQP